MPKPTRPQVFAWLTPEQAGLFRSVTREAGLDLVGAGSPEAIRGGEVAEALGTRVVENLRTELATTKADLVILGALGEFGAPAREGAEGASDVDDAETLRACRARGVKVVSLEPLPSSVLQLDEPTLTTPDMEGAGVVLGQAVAAAAAASASGLPSEWAMFCPLARLSKPVRDAAELIAQLGKVRAVAVESLTGDGQGSLGARLYDACEAVVWLLGMPDRVDGAFAAAARGRGHATHGLPGETLRGLEGDMTVNMRFADGRAASVLASNRAGRWMRTITMLGENGRLRVFDDGFAWTGADGRLIDSSRDQTRSRGESSDAAGRMIAEQITRLMDEAIPPEAPTDGLSVLATAGAALLSARTGENESPATILRMARSG